MSTSSIRARYTRDGGRCRAFRSGAASKDLSLCRLPSPINPPTFRWRELIEPWSPGVWRVRSVVTSTRVERVLGSTRVERALGSSSWSTTVPGVWSVERAPTAHHLRLSDDLRAGGAPSRFGVARRIAFKTVVLRGVWSFDALSVDGRTPFRTESIGKGRYWVRSVDVATGRTGDPIVTKSITPTSGEVDEGPMWVLRYT